MTLAEWLLENFPLFVEFWDSLMLSPVDVGAFWLAAAIHCIVGLYVVVGYFVKRQLEKWLRKGRKIRDE